MTTVFNSYNLERDKKRYRVEHHIDCDATLGEQMDVPLRWANDKNHKRPRDRIVPTRDRGYLLFDFARQVASYRQGGVSGKDAAAYAEQDYERVCKYYNDDWCYMGVVVTPCCECCGQPDVGKCESLWAIESDSGDEYLESVVNELVMEVAHA